MLKYTICFIIRGHQILMLNRNKSPVMGVWNGVGGKLEKNETPETCVIREVFEETGIHLDQVIEKGIVTWNTGNGSGMHAFMAEIPADFDYIKPKRTDEGILDWKTLEWLTHPDNQGVASHLKRFLPIMVHDFKLYEFQCIFNENGSLGECRPIPLEKVIL